MESYGTFFVDVLGDTYLPPIERTAIRVDKACGDAGIDIFSLGDDIGTQSSIMIAVGLWEKWLKPRLSRIIDTEKKSINAQCWFDLCQIII